MAEALSIAASGIAVAQIAGQVGKAVLKLKRLWDEVKDVPDNIADLMQQIDCIGPVLWEVENNMPELPSMLWNNSATKRNTEYCHKALAALTGCVNELNMHIDSRKRASKRLGAIKVVLKKDQLSKLEKRLGSALRMLSFAQQSYLIGSQKT
ncbi:hypothetical protein F5B20DRAFT_63167 [Whalleya microplaca]|nr:hypothetical protein F5B20DRAFT_63167 [Whalleya microplaca]